MVPDFFHYILEGREIPVLLSYKIKNLNYKRLNQLYKK